MRWFTEYPADRIIRHFWTSFEPARNHYRACGAASQKILKLENTNVLFFIMKNTKQIMGVCTVQCTYIVHRYYFKLIHQMVFLTGYQLSNTNGRCIPQISPVKRLQEPTFCLSTIPIIQNVCVHSSTIQVVSGSTVAGTRQTWKTPGLVPGIE